MTIQSKPPTKEYQEGWDRIFGSKSQQKRIQAQQQTDAADWLEDWQEANPSQEEGE